MKYNEIYKGGCRYAGTEVVHSCGCGGADRTDRPDDSELFIRGHPARKESRSPVAFHTTGYRIPVPGSGCHRAAYGAFG